MRVRVVAIGRLKAGPERDLVERYRSRAEVLSRALGITGPDIVEIPESRRRSAAERRVEEAAATQERIGDAVPVVLDETAPSLDSEAFSRRLLASRDAGRDVAFLIGGADGLSAELREAAGWSLSFGRLTLPHQLVRVVLLEQIYRAWTIAAGHPYHRAGSDGA